MTWTLVLLPLTCALELRSWQILPGPLALAWRQTQNSDELERRRSVLVAPLPAAETWANTLPARHGW